MTNREYSTSVSKMKAEIDQLKEIKWLRGLIPERTLATYDALCEFIAGSRILLLNKGMWKSLTVFNIFTWYKFVKLSYNFVKKIIEIWK
jgi:hypothetical protein